MANISVADIIQYTYTRFPMIYRQKDLEMDEERPPLLHFIAAMFQGYDKEDGTHFTGAGEYVLDKANTFTDLIDPDKCPDDMFPYLFESFGLPYNPLIETKTNELGEPIIYYHRKFLSNIGELLKRRGTKSGLEYLIRVLTGFECQTSYKRGYNEDGQYGRHLTINLIINSADDENKRELSKPVIEQFLKPFLPHYINIHIGESRTYATIEASQATVAVPMYSTDFNVTPLEAQIDD